MSNYPPGVSGNEFQITGPLEEWTVEGKCEYCTHEGTFDAWWHPDEGAWAECSKCLTVWELPDRDLSDPDLEYDLWREERDQDAG